MIEALERPDHTAQQLVLNADFTREGRFEAMRMLLRDMEPEEKPGIVKLGAGFPWLNNAGPMMEYLRTVHQMTLFADVKLSEDPRFMKATVKEIFDKGVNLVSVASHVGYAGLRAAAEAQDTDHKVVLAVPHEGWWQRHKDFTQARKVNRHMDAEQQLNHAICNVHYVSQARRVLRLGDKAIVIATGVRLSGQYEDRGDHPNTATLGEAVGVYEANAVSTGVQLSHRLSPDQRIEKHRALLANLQEGL